MKTVLKRVAALLARLKPSPPPPEIREAVLRAHSRCC